MLSNILVETERRYRELCSLVQELSNAKQGNSWDRKCVSTKKERKVTKRKKERLEPEANAKKGNDWALRAKHILTKSIS